MRLPISAALFAVSCALPVFGATPAPAPAGATVNIGDPIALTFYVAPKNLAALEAKAKSLQTVGSSDYHQFLTRQEFVNEYAVSNTELAAIEGSLKGLGFNISYVFPNHLAIEVTGTVSTAQNALGMKLTRSTVAGKTGYTPDREITLPASLQGKIRGVGGLNTLIHARPLHVKSVIKGQSVSRPVGKSNLVGGTPGDYLPADFARIYGVDGVYNRGFKGRGTTVGIVTLNDFKTSDAYLFWKSIGLSVNQNRITKVDVDGGIESPYNNPDGEGETDLDTEYSGALAPDANVRVYIAPIATNSGFTNGFEAAASENIADTISTSWGEPELFYFAQHYYPFDGNSYPSETFILDEFHDVFLEMAVQGQTIYAAAGDSGSFDTVRGCPTYGAPDPNNPICNAPFSADSPSNDPLVTAAGGTTLPFSFFTQSGLHFYVNQERAWGWDYLAIEAAQGGADLLSEVFSVGAGGGVSSYFGVPWYQAGHQGISRTMSGQSLTVDRGTGPMLDVSLPSGFAGRNTPDLSANADPESGYQAISEGYVIDGYGGTSFVAPQLNGVTALFVEAMGGRIGQINPFLYRSNYSSSRDIKLGDNWGYQAAAGYDNATGVGVLTADKLLTQMLELKNYKK